MNRIKEVINKNRKLLVVLGLIVVVIIVSLIFKGKHYSDKDYLIIDNKGTLIGFSEYNETKDMLVKYNNKGERSKDTYSKGDTLVVLVKKEKKDIVVIPKEVKAIKKDLFIGTDYIKTIKIDMDIKKIEDEMFMNSTFKKIILNDNIKTIGKKAFMNNVYLKEVEGKVEKVEDSAFENDVALKTIDLKYAKEIGNSAFKGCNSIKKDLFIDTNYIKTIKIDMDIKKIEDEMFMNSTFKKIILNDNIKSIGKKAFMNNVYLKEVEGKVERVEESAFENDVSLKTINLKSAKEVGENAFKGCNSIKKLYISKDIEKIGKDAFKYLGNRSIIYLEESNIKRLIEGKYTLGKTTVVIDNKHFK